MKKKEGIVVPLGALYCQESIDIGDFLSLKKLADFCKLADIQIIQLLPVNDTGNHSSPYSGLSAYALHPIYIRIEALPEFNEALKNKSFASAYKTYKKNSKYSNRFNYLTVLQNKINLLHLIFNIIEKKYSSEIKKTVSSKVNVVEVNSDLSEYQDLFKKIDDFAKKNKWLVPYAVFKNLKDVSMQSSWKEWEENYRNMSKEQILLRWNNKALKSSHNFYVWLQMRCHEQFLESANYIKSLGIILKGDIPILMNEDSSDCWAWPEFFCQEERAGSPPDGENPFGQNWGFPTYNWDRLETDDFTWWKERIKTAAKYYDAFRIDHILGFFRIWANSENETSAYLGHTIPYSSISRKVFEENDFTEERLDWLSKPHIPTSLIEDITWNHEEATNILESICTRIKDEELWIFSDEIKFDKDILSFTFADDKDKDLRIKNAFLSKWKDRTLIEITKNNFVPVYSYKNSTAWNSLNDDEKSAMEEIFAENRNKENLLWKKHALKTLKVLTSSSDMKACAEDLGVSLPCMDEVLKELNILSLKVFRWERKWESENQEFIPFEDYKELSVATSSVHDSSTIRQWWTNEKSAVKQFLKQEEELYVLREEKSNKSKGKIQKELFDEEIKFPFSYEDEFSSEIAQFLLERFAETRSLWFINPLQDYLYLEKKYYLENPDDERINVPGSVNDFNWTYRIPAQLEDLCKDESLIEKIKKISYIHKSGDRIETKEK